MYSEPEKTAESQWLLSDCVTAREELSVSSEGPFRYAGIKY